MLTNVKPHPVPPILSIALGVVGGAPPVVAPLLSSRVGGSALTSTSDECLVHSVYNTSCRWLLSICAGCCACPQHGATIPALHLHGPIKPELSARSDSQFETKRRLAPAMLHTIATTLLLLSFDVEIISNLTSSLDSMSVPESRQALRLSNLPLSAAFSSACPL